MILNWDGRKRSYGSCTTERLNDAGGARINFVLWRIKPVGWEIDRASTTTEERVSCGSAMMVRRMSSCNLGASTRVRPFGPKILISSS
jgi:hypothetical protein